MGAVDVPALLLATVLSTGITAALAFLANTGVRRRDWMAAGAIALVLMALGAFDLLREQPRETHIATAVVGALLPVAGAMGMMRATRRVRPWMRWSVIFLAAFVLLIGGLVLGAAVLPRFLGA